MKALKKRNLTVVIPGLKEVNTIYLIGECLDNTLDKGFSYEDLKSRQRIEDACKKAKATSIQFEDNDAKNLQSIVSQMRWAMRHNDIMQFCEDVENMK